MDTDEKGEEVEPGVWAYCERDYGQHIDSVYTTELEALRVLNTMGAIGEVRFVPFGLTLTQLDAREAAK
jgi:hypothetical protein